MTRQRRPDSERARPSRARSKLKRWGTVIRDTLFGGEPKPAERAHDERGEHSGIGFSYKARDGL